MTPTLTPTLTLNLTYPPSLCRYPRSRSLVGLLSDWHKGSREYFDLEAKKRGGKELHVDASYKAMKHIGRYHGQRIWKGLMSGLNEHGDLILCHAAVTDGHDQLNAALDGLNETREQYGFDPIELVLTDKPSDEVNFFEHKFPAVKALRESVNAQHGGQAQGGVVEGNGLPNIDTSRMKYVRMVSSAESINTVCDSIRDVIAALPKPFQVIGLDGEWDTPKNARGQPCGQDKISLVQLAYPLEVRALHLPCTCIYSAPLFPNAVSSPLVTGVQQLSGCNGILEV